MIHYLYSKDGFTYCHSIQCKMLLFVYIYVDLLKLKAYKLFEISDADLSWLLFLKKPTCLLYGLTICPENGYHGTKTIAETLILILFTIKGSPSHC